MTTFNGLARKIALATTLVRRGDLPEAASIVRHKVWADLHGMGLRRDLAQPFPAPAATLPITIRLLREDDVPHLLDVQAPDLSGAERHDRMNRLLMLQAGFDACYVAVTEEDHPCYMQWLIGPAENDRLRRHFGGLFPPLAPDEALLEGAYTPPHCRGKRIMPCAMAQIAEQASKLGARWVITFVGNDNIPSLKGCKRSGFVPYLTRTETWRFCRRRIAFTPLPAGTPYSFDAVDAAAGESPATASAS